MAHSGLSQMGRRTTDPPITWLMQTALSRPGLISLAAGFTDNPTLPARATRQLLDRLLSRRATAEPALQYGSTAGDPRLRRLTAERLAALEAAAVGQLPAAVRTLCAPGGSPCQPAEPDAARLLMTHGSQQLLYLVAEALCDPGDIVLVEDPTYFVWLGIVQSHGLQCRGVAMEPDGLSLPHLAQVLDELRQAGQLPRVKLLYTVSYHQNPSGITTAFHKKAAILELLRDCERRAGHPIYILEDAAYRELRFSGPDEPSYLALPGAADRVIHSSTFSKPFATGIRVGWGLLPAVLYQAAVRLKGNHDFGTACLLQHLLAEALASGEYERHLAGLRRRYARKAQILAGAMREHLPDSLSWQDPAGGLYIWAKLPGKTRTGLRSPLFQAALDHGLLYVPGELCYAPDPARQRPANELGLSFGNATEPDLREGIRRLGQAWRGLKTK